MQFYNIKKQQEIVSFKEAVLKGLGSDKGLFAPNNIPRLQKDFFDKITSLTTHEIAHQVLYPFVSECIPEIAFKKIIADTFTFDIPLKKLADQTYVLELFHGPTLAFKDVGARFMANCISYLNNSSKKLTVLVATSGDTGGAVAHGFLDKNGVEVNILFPKGKVSNFQEHQMTSLGKNINAIEVEGSFDDCQALVKAAFSDVELKEKHGLTSANSINIARLLPQMLFAFLAYKALKSIEKEAPIHLAIPSGNLGNLTAVCYAVEMGLPIHSIIAGVNENNAFEAFLIHKKYASKPTKETISNAMDVGNPNNIDRIIELYKADPKRLFQLIKSVKISDSQTRGEMRKEHVKSGYILDPHGAVGKLALDHFISEEGIGVFYETAHPSKFHQVVKQEIDSFNFPEFSLKNCVKTKISNSYAELKKVLNE